MFYHNLNPVLLRLGPIEIRYYGLFFLIGFIIAYYMLIHLSKKKGLALSKDDIADFMMYLVIGVILGARIIYVVVYNLDFYLTNPLEIVAIWHGGLSFHGGLIGSIIAGMIFCKKKNLHFLELADILVIPASLGLVFGRLANFINGELVGRITNLSWAVKFPCCEGFRHPSQIYEAIKNLIIFFTLWNIGKKKFPKGTLFFMFIMMYSLLRFFIEFFREPDTQIGFVIFGLTMGQILNMLMFLAGAVFMMRVYKRD